MVSAQEGWVFTTVSLSPGWGGLTPATDSFRPCLDIHVSQGGAHTTSQGLSAGNAETMVLVNLGHIATLVELFAESLTLGSELPQGPEFKVNYSHLAHELNLPPPLHVCKSPSRPRRRADCLPDHLLFSPDASAGA